MYKPQKKSPETVLTKIPTFNYVIKLSISGV